MIHGAAEVSRSSRGAASCVCSVVTATLSSAPKMSSSEAAASAADANAVLLARAATDPAALDGALQLAVLWTEHVLGDASLPTRVAAVRLWADGPLGQLRGVVSGRSAEGHRAVCDVALIAADGRLAAELHGVETHLLPGD